jgi:hypothetical protein
LGAALGDGVFVSDVAPGFSVVTGFEVVADWSHAATARRATNATGSVIRFM